MKHSTILRLLILTILILPSGPLFALPKVHAQTGSVFTISQEAFNTCTQNCQWASYFDDVKVINGNNDVFSITSDHFGDSQGQISNANQAYPILQTFYAKSFVYNPSSPTDLHLYANYWVNAYVYASNACCGTSGWLFVQYRIYTTRADGSLSDVISAHQFEYDAAITSCSPFCPSSPAITSINQAKTFDQDIGGSCPGQFCNFVIGQTYIFEVLFEITANPGAYIQNTHGGPSYASIGFAGSNQDFANQEFCLALSYQSSPATSCPGEPLPTSTPAPPYFTMTPATSYVHCVRGHRPVFQ